MMKIYTKKVNLSIAYNSTQIIWNRSNIFYLSKETLLDKVNGSRLAVCIVIWGIFCYFFEM